MTEPLTFIGNKDHTNLIIFIHGFKGGKKTWIIKGGKKSILNYLQEDDEVNSNFDFAVFEYFTKVTDYFAYWRGILGYVINPNILVKRNFSISEISDLLFTEISIHCKKYERIVLVCHSMGGLVAKSVIIKNIDKGSKLPISLYLRLATPHRGADPAIYAKLIFGNPQIKGLAPLASEINLMHDKWINKKITSLLPDTLYFCGFNDLIVTKDSAKGLDSREIEPIYSEHNHTTIKAPKTANDTVVVQIKDKCPGLIKIPKEKFVSRNEAKQQTPASITHHHYYGDKKKSML